MTALVTGATGLIGNHVVKYLLTQNHKVNILVRRESDLCFMTDKNVKIFLGDILSAESIKNAAKGCDIIYHAAGTFSYWGYDPDQFISDSEIGMRNIVEAANRTKQKRVVFTSSSVTLGAYNEPIVISENKTGDLDELSNYERAKIAQEKIAFLAGKELGVAVIAICPTLTIGGPDNRLTESNRMIINYLKDPLKSTWLGGCNIVSVADVASAMVLIGDKGKPGERYIAGSNNITWKELHSMISELCGVAGPYLTAYHTSSYLSSLTQEMWARLSGTRPVSTRDQAKMVGKFYWYDSSKISKLGCRFKSSEEALIETLSWLVTSKHVSASLRASMKLSKKVYAFRMNNNL